MLMLINNHRMAHCCSGGVVLHWPISVIGIQNMLHP